MQVEELVSYSNKLNLLYVEDSKETRELTITLFEDIFGEIYTASNGEEGIEVFKENKIDIIISDLNMPVMNGIEMLEEIRQIDKEVPMLILTAYTDSDYLIEGIKQGINGYILKPIDYNQMLDTLSRSVENIKLREELLEEKRKLAQINEELKKEMAKKTNKIYELSDELIDTQREVVFTMGAIGESRSKETGNHVRRVALYSEILARHYGLEEEKVQLLKEASPMHDIGKVAIPDNILNKPSSLSEKEWEIMKSHTQLGYDMLKHSNTELLKVAAIVAYEHHERYDGFGYPRGLKGEEISIYGRITALADVFDALGNKRCYKDAWADKQIDELFLNEKSKQFDPILVDIFFENKEEFYKIRDENKDI